MYNILFIIVSDDVSSISGSETDSETETELSSTDVESSKCDDTRLTHLIARRSRILFNNVKGEVISVHRALLLNKKVIHELNVTEICIFQVIQQLILYQVFCIYLLFKMGP